METNYNEPGRARDLKLSEQVSGVIDEGILHYAGVVINKLTEDGAKIQPEKIQQFANSRVGRRILTTGLEIAAAIDERTQAREAAVRNGIRVSEYNATQEKARLETLTPEQLTREVCGAMLATALCVQIANEPIK